MARQDNTIEPPIYRKVDLPQILTSKDISSYIKAFTSSFLLFSMPRVEALLHVIRAVETNHIETEIATSHRLEPGYRSVRDVQDLLRYLLYEIDKRCPEGGSIRPTEVRELKVAGLTASKFSEISVLRDLDLMVTYGWGAAEIVSDEKLIRFVPEEAVLADSAREHENFTEGAERLGLTISSMDQQSIRQSSRLLESSVGLAPANSLTYSIQPEIVHGFYKAAKESSHFLAGKLVPEDWQVGPYTISDYHVFYHLLQARCMINYFAIKHALVSRRLAPRLPYNSASLVLSREELVRDALDVGGLPKGVTEEMIRDLTYSPREVKWTEVTYQPLIPLKDNSLFAVVPAVVEASSFDRNLLALIERLPWRKAAAESLKVNREDEMIKQLDPLLRTYGFVVASRIGLGEKTARISDIDILVWSSTGETVMPISLKWFYGPDSMQEVYNHSERYRKALVMHRKAVDYLKRNLTTVSNNKNFAPPLSQSARMLPILVTFQDELLERDRVPDIPAVTLPQFIRATEGCEGSLDRLYDSVQTISARRGSEPADQAFERINMGKYTFEIPTLYFS